MDHVFTIIGSNIRRARRNQMVKIETLAKHLGLTKGRLSQIENGQCKEVTLNRLVKIATFLNTDFFEILGKSPQEDTAGETRGFHETLNYFPQDLIGKLADQIAARISQP